MVRRKLRLIATVGLTFMLVFVLAGGAVAAQPPEMVKVLIGFDRQPGPNEEAVVRGVGGTIKYTYRLIPVIAATVPEVAIRGLEANPNVTYVEEDGIVYATEETLPWGVDRIDAEVVHSTNKGLGIKVAILDTGIDRDHPDLNVVGGVNFAAGKGYDDKNGHGTHVAGIVAALDNNYGVIGVAPLAALYAVKVLGNGGMGSWSDVIAGILWSVDPNGDGNFDDRMDVINMSLGGGDYASLKAACDAAYAAGIVVVSSAGNSGDTNEDDDVGYPAKYDSVIAVAATTNTDSRASWSSDGPAVELAAPGVRIYSTWKGGGYNTISGTSMASPHVAGVAALVIASGITNNAQVRQKLADTATDLDPDGRDPWYGWGLVDAEKAVLGTTVGDNLVIDTGSINGTVTDTSTELVIANATVTVEGTSLSATTDNSGDYTIADVPVGTYTVTASATGYQSQSVNNVTVTNGATTTVNFALSPSTGDTLMHVASITYATSGGKNGDKHLLITVALVDDLSNAVSGASVAIKLENTTTGQSWTGADTTGADGTVTFSLKNAPSGIYTTTVTNVTADGLTWDGDTPPNSSD